MMIILKKIMNINILNEWLDEYKVVNNSTDLKKSYYNNIDIYYTKKEIKRLYWC